MKKALWGILILLVLVVAGLWGLAAYEANRAQSLQARAALEISRAAEVASVGHTVATVNLGLIAFLLLVALLLLIAAYLYMRLRTLPRRRPRRQAHFDPRWEQPEVSLSSAGLTDMLQTLVQLEALRMLQQMQQPNQNMRALSAVQPPALPGFDVDIIDEDEDIDDWQDDWF